MKSNGIEKRKMTSEREILRNGMGGKHILTWSELWGRYGKIREFPIKIGWSCKMSEKDSESSKGELRC